MQRPVLLCYDGSEDARAAISAAGRLLDGSALVATVWNPTHADVLAAHAPTLGPAVRKAVAELDEFAANEALERAEEGCALARDIGFAPEPVTVEGSPRTWMALVQLAEDRDVAAIVLGRRGRSPVTAALFGSVSTGVLHHARRPVLAVPASDGAK